MADDGTVVIIARAHYSSRTAFVVALYPDLTVKWAATLLERFSDGCGVPISQGGSLPPNGEAGGCRTGSKRGVDPATNTLGSGRVLDDSSASPVLAPDIHSFIAPDGSVYYGAYTRWAGLGVRQFYGLGVYGAACPDRCTSVALSVRIKKSNISIYRSMRDYPAWYNPAMQLSSSFSLCALASWQYVQQ